MPRCQQQPFVSLDPILRHAVAPFVADGQIVLRLGVIVLGGFAIPFHRLRVILRHTVDPIVADTQVVLSGGEILFGGFAIPFTASTSSSVTPSPFVADAKVVLLVRPE